MKSVLVEKYKTNISLSALPAFLAVANCSENEKAKQSRFLNFFDENENKILDYSSLQKFKHWLINDFVRETKEKIKRANFIKVSTVIEDVSKKIENQNSNFLKIIKEIERNKKNVSQKLLITSDSTKNKFKVKLDDCVREFQKEYRNSMYEYIDEDHSNSDVKHKLETEYEIQVVNLRKDIEKEYSVINDNYANEIEDILKKYEKIKNEIIDISFTKDNGNFSFNFEFAPKKKSYFGELISSAAGVIGALILGLSNPAGWAALGLAILSAVISIGKFIWGLFDSSYKKAQQKKSSNENIEKCAKTIKEKIEIKLKEINGEMDKNIKNINDVLDNEIKKFKNTTEIFRNIDNDLKQLNYKVKENL